MGWELEIVGSHGMQAHRYPEMMQMIESGQLPSEKLIHEKITLEQATSSRFQSLYSFDQFVWFV
ncbi:MAG: alcohol dehydrogenase [Granulosicoccus sp.]|jgi:alcohol dehydrogenase